MGARAGRRARGGAAGSVSARKEKKAEVFLLISRQLHRVSGRARDFQRARPAQTLGVGGGLESPPGPGRVPGPRLSQVLLRACRRRGPSLQSDPSQAVCVRGRGWLTAGTPNAE